MDRREKDPSAASTDAPRHVPDAPPHDPDVLVVKPVEREVGRVLSRYGIGAVLLALVVAAALFRNWTVFAIGVVFAAAFIVLITAPLWLAVSTETADTTQAREAGLRREDVPRP